jgi:hypothetical protein
MPSFRAPLLAGVLAATLTGCSSSAFGLTPQPDGNIVVTNYQTGATIASTLANPYMVSAGSFAIGISEDHFGGPYTVNVVQWTADFNIPCFVPHYVDSSNQTNVVSFRSDNGAPVTDPTEPNPCIQGDEETAQIADSKGHTVQFYYELTASVPQDSFARSLRGAGR